jgi:hypothetical protein
LLNENWIARMGLQDSDLWMKYTAAFYWTIQTVLTVGYGDIQARTIEEKLFACIWMLIGVMVYSFMIGSVSSILAYNNAQKEQDMHMLNILAKIRIEYKLPVGLYIKAKKAVKLK